MINSKNKISLEQSNNERIFLIRSLSVALGWKFDEKEYQNRILQSYAQIKLHNKAYIRIFWANGCGFSVSATLYVLGEKIRYIGFNLQRGSLILAKDINRRLIYDLNDVYKRIKADKDKKEEENASFNLRVSFFENQLINQNIKNLMSRQVNNICFGFEHGARYDHDLVIQSGLMQVSSFKRDYDLKLMLSKQHKKVHILLCGVSESTAIKVINLINGEREIN